MNDPRTPGSLVLLVGVIVVALRWIIPAVSDVELSSMANLILSSTGAVLAVIGFMMILRAGRSDVDDQTRDDQRAG